MLPALVLLTTVVSALVVASAILQRTRPYIPLLAGMWGTIVALSVLGGLGVLW